MTVRLLRRVLLILGTLALSWYGMMLVHEVGHCLGAWIGGGTVQRVVFHPLRFTETVVNPNPRPLLTVWLGPIVGVTLPLIVWGAMALAKVPGHAVARFVAGFCLLANGSYIGAGSFDRVADAGVMLFLGAPIWTLWLFGLVTAPAGLALWHGLGPAFDIGGNRRPVRAGVVVGVWIALAVVMALGLVFGEPA